MPHARRFVLLCALLGLILQSIPAQAQLRYPPAVTPEEQLAELGEFLAAVDLRKEHGALGCTTAFSIDGKRHPEEQMVCERQLERRIVKKLMQLRTCSISGALRAVHDTASGLGALHRG